MQLNYDASGTSVSAGSAVGRAATTAKIEKIRACTRFHVFYADVAICSLLAALTNFRLETR